MTKTRRMIEEDIKLIDLVIELLDSRIPMSSRNPDIDRLSQGKARMVILNKADLSDGKITERWIEYFRSRGITCSAIDSRASGSAKRLTPAIMEACREKIERNKRRGIKNRPVRALVAGVPNVGKSTFINSFAGRKLAKTGNKPGVTRGKQWIRLNNDVELLDTPGILWPKFEDQIVGLHLAMIGAIKEDVMNLEELSIEILTHLGDNSPELIEQRYGIGAGSPLEMLQEIAKVRGCLLKGGEYDYAKASKIVVDEFKNGVIGRFSLEKPEDY
jgi:ribosome biogenesis GTPase A